MIIDFDSCIFVLNQIFKSAARYAVSAEDLSTELQQLGLPKGLELLQ